jgi:hypothetical protein
VEPEPDTAGVQRLTPHQFATRMALLLWSSVPDAMLLDLADANQSFEPETIRTQLHRMLADDRSRALGENFGLQGFQLVQSRVNAGPVIAINGLVQLFAQACHSLFEFNKLRFTVYLK